MVVLLTLNNLERFPFRENSYQKDLTKNVAIRGNIFTVEKDTKLAEMDLYVVMRILRRAGGLHHPSSFS